jgi:hypothetical protein
VVCRYKGVGRALEKKLWFFARRKTCFHAPRHQQTTPTQHVVECSDVSSMNRSDEKMMGSSRVSVPMERVKPLLRVVTMLLPISPPFKRRQQTLSHSSSLHEAPCHGTHHAKHHNHHSISLSRTLHTSLTKRALYARTCALQSGASSGGDRTPTEAPTGSVVAMSAVVHVTDHRPSSNAPTVYHAVPAIPAQRASGARSPASSHLSSDDGLVAMVTLQNSAAEVGRAGKKSAARKRGNDDDGPPDGVVSRVTSGRGDANGGGGAWQQDEDSPSAPADGSGPSKSPPPHDSTSSNDIVASAAELNSDAGAAGAGASSAAPEPVRKLTKSMTTYDSAADLATDDDILCDVFVDNALGFQTHKMQKDYQRIDVDRVKLEEAMLLLGADNDVDKAFKRIFGPDGVVPREALSEERAARLDSPQFEEHAMRYLRMFMPSSGYCILPDDRYTGDRVDRRKMGGKIAVTRSFQQGSKIDALYGCIAEVTREEEHTLLRHGACMPCALNALNIFLFCCYVFQPLSCFTLTHTYRTSRYACLLGMGAFVPVCHPLPRSHSMPPLVTCQAKTIFP